jgi:hypothetical protein
MLGRSQAGSWRVDDQHHNNDDDNNNNYHQENEPIFEINSTVPKPKTRRGGVKVRARAARRAKRLALEEEQRKASARAQANAEAAENAIRLSEMQNALHEQQDAEDKTTKQLKREAGDTKTSYLADLEGLAPENTAEREGNAGGELDLEVKGGGFGECECEIVCVCETAQCKCADGCICI